MCSMSVRAGEITRGTSPFGFSLSSSVGEWGLMVFYSGCSGGLFSSLFFGG